MIRVKLKVEIMVSYPNSPVDIIQLYFLMTTYVIFWMYCCIILEIY